MKWYWILLIAVVALVIGYMIGKAKVNGKEFAFQNKVSSELDSVLGQISNPGTRTTSADRTKLINQRDSLLRLKNPTMNSANVIIFDGTGYWNGWTYVNPSSGTGITKLRCTQSGNYWVWNGSGYSCINNKDVV